MVPATEQPHSNPRPGQNLSDRYEERPGVTVEGVGPSVTCERCRKNSLLVGVWFWGYRREGYSLTSVAKASDANVWLCPVCASMGGSTARGRRVVR